MKVYNSGPLWRLVPPYGDSWGSFRFRLDQPLLTNIWLGHLWFLQFLFLISLLMLPLLLYLRSESGQRVIKRVARWSDRPGWPIPTPDPPGSRADRSERFLSGVP